MQNDRNFFRYWVPSPEVVNWGFYVFNVGRSKSIPGMPYPPQTHPKDHALTWKAGRSLSSPALLYIAHGGGTFESKPSGKVLLRAGDVVLLHPDVWHRYKPDNKIGWEEYWVEFDGIAARRFLKRPEFDPSKGCVATTVRCDEMKESFDMILSMAQKETLGIEYRISAEVIKMIAHLLQGTYTEKNRPSSSNQLIVEARKLLEVEPNSELQLLAAKHNLSYSHFRRLFKRHTGFSPRQYALQHRLQRARNLLRNTKMGISDISNELKFESLYYFSQLFKRKYKISPSAFRASVQC